jgi:hypothetical protein
MSLRARIPRDVPGKSQVKAEAKRERTAAGHVELIRQLPCAVTGAPPRSDPHHLMRTGEPGARGMSLTTAGKWTIPLCRKVHDEITKKGEPEEFLMEKYGLDARALAQSLWRVSGDLEAMERVVFRATNEARKHRKTSAELDAALAWLLDGGKG